MSLYADSTSLNFLVELPWRFYTKTCGSANTAEPIAPSPVAAQSLTKDGALATFKSATPHRLIEGQQVTISGADLEPYNGRHRIMVVSGTQFAYVMDVEPDDDASGTITASYVAHAQRALLIVPSGGGAVSFGPDVNADAFSIAAGNEKLIEAPKGAKFNLGAWYAKSATGSAPYTVLFV
jgi:hypothetical protein